MNGLEIVSQIGIFVLLVALIVGLIYFATSLSRELQDQKRDVADLRREVIETIGPTFDQMTELMKSQDHINNELIRQMNTQTEVLKELKELKSQYRELTSKSSNTDD